MSLPQIYVYLAPGEASTEGVIIKSEEEQLAVNEMIARNLEQ
jgi:hypothetical protein